MTTPTNSQELAQPLQTELAQAEYEPLLPIENALKGIAGLARPPKSRLTLVAHTIKKVDLIAPW